MLLLEAEQRTRLGRGTRGVSVWGHCVAVASRKVDEGERGHRDDALASRLAPCGSEGCCQSGGERRSFRMRTARAFAPGEPAPPVESREDSGTSFSSSRSPSFRL